MTIGQEFQGSFRHHFHLKCTQNPLELRDDVFFIESPALLVLADVRVCVRMAHHR